MQYGNLSVAEIRRFENSQNYMVRKPSYTLWIEGFGMENSAADPAEHIMKIDTEVALESYSGQEHLNIGKAVVVANNKDGSFYREGKSSVSSNAKIRIWAGFDNLNIPIFTGIVVSVNPLGSEDVVELVCEDYMRLFAGILIEGSQEPNNTPKLIMENFCSMVNIPFPNIPSTYETMSPYPETYFEEQSILEALEEVCNSIFYMAYFDEEGRLNSFEHEYKNPVRFQFEDNNIIDCQNKGNTEIINDISIEYDPGFYTKWRDQWSIDTFGRSSRSYDLFLVPSTKVSEKTNGATEEDLRYQLQGFRFTTSEDAVFIDGVHIRMRQNDAHGYINANIYTDNDGIPGTLLATSQLKASANLSNEFTWELFYFATPISVSPLCNYWVVVDTNSLSSGKVYAQTNEDTGLPEYARYDGTWSIENKQVLHKIRGSKHAQRLAEDIANYYRTPRERITIEAPGVPQLQILDEVFIDIGKPEIYGHYVIEGRRHIMSPGNYITIDSLIKID